jgi:integrase
MATITPRNGYHQLNWTDAQGKRHRVSLGQIGAIPKRELDAILQAKEFELSNAARLLNVHRRPSPRFDDWVARYKLWHQAEFPDSTYRVAQILDDHLVPWFGPTPLNLITVDQAEDYKTARRFKVRASTVAKELRVLQAVLNRAVAVKTLEQNPVAIVQAPQQLDSRPHHYYQVDELAEIYRQSAYGPIWRLMANTGLRRGEALALRWLWITDHIRIQSTGEERTKSGEWRKIPKGAGAAAALAAIPHPDKATHVLPRIAPESLSRAFLRDARAAGLPGSLHSLRHTYVCQLLLAGENIRTVQIYAGHAHISTTERYAYQALHQHSDKALQLAI